MDLASLDGYLDKLIAELGDKDKQFIKGKIKELIAIFPFNKYEYALIFLRDRNLITFQEYQKLRDDYVNSNKYLHLYGIAPRVFGQIWGEEHIRSIDNRFKKACKDLDPQYGGEYDIWLDGIKLEVKACRAINSKKRGDLVSKALRYDSNDPFWMNFQQLKLDSCQVFIFIGVFVDQIIYWVMSSKEAKNSEYISHQHRGGIEYQIGITDKNISEFDVYKVPKSKVVDTIFIKANKE